VTRWAVYECPRCGRQMVQLVACAEVVHQCDDRLERTLRQVRLVEKEKP